MLTVLEILKRTTDFFASRGIEHPRLDAELLVGHALGLKRMQLYLQFERPLSEAELEKVRPLVRRRAQREPWQYIVGEMEWGGMKLKVDRRALIPRPETELLIEEIVVKLLAAPGRILDLGTGSGAIALALATRYPLAGVVAVDASQVALDLAQENARSMGMERVQFIRSDWFSNVPAAAGFDVIVANPPYLTQSESAATQPEVRDHEPATALVAEEDGLADLLKIIGASPRYLAEGGLLALETGIHHHAALGIAGQAAGLVRSESRPDLTGRDRFFFAWREGAFQATPLNP